MNDALIAAVGVVTTVINAIWIIVMRGVKSELKTMRAEVAGQLSAVTTKIDLHVIDRLSRAESELKELGEWRRNVEHQLATIPRRRTDP